MSLNRIMAISHYYNNDKCFTSASSGLKYRNVKFLCLTKYDAIKRYGGVVVSSTYF